MPNNPNAKVTDTQQRAQNVVQNNLTTYMDATFSLGGLHAEAKKNPILKVFDPKQIKLMRAHNNVQRINQGNSTFQQQLL